MRSQRTDCSSISGALLTRTLPVNFRLWTITSRISKGDVCQLCDLINNNNLRFTWKCQARADQLDAELVAAMAKSGCFEIDLGIESGDVEIQRYIRKNLNLKRTLDTVASIRNHGMVCKAFFMLGFPNESHAQIAETINFAVELSVTGYVAFFPVMPFPGTEISAVTGKVVFQVASSTMCLPVSVRFQPIDCASIRPSPKSHSMSDSPRIACGFW